ncbi:rolling circle replication-associated protein [Alkaliphilus oremlandii]|uniref:rolling circle replication-associated protein n=1 Tax=Alkaliphilus oremlandii TaxID=461876 RepID=UPI0002D52D2E|nr:hypothetical protein [Alkaliphilus oremlandii]
MLNLLSSNFQVKISGQKVTFKKYAVPMQFNFGVKPSLKAKRGDSSMARDNFNKSIARSRNRIFDIIACNVNVLPDYEGNIQLPKFLTLTFAENITDLQTANAEFTTFNKRLSYHLYKTNKNVLKYICIPEFQKRGAVHFHVLYFNLPYVNIKKISEVWGHGYAFIEGITEKQNIEDFAKYVCKYMSKNNSKGEDNYQIYLEKEMLNSKRYFTSRGLNKPEIYKLDVDKEIYQTFITYFQEYHKENLEYSNEFIGTVEVNSYEINKSEVLQMLKNAIYSIFESMKTVYGKKATLTRFKDINYLKTLFKNRHENLYIDSEYLRLRRERNELYS